MTDNDLCPKCGTPIVQSIKGSLDTFIAGYLICWKCRTRIDLEKRSQGRVPDSGGKPGGPAAE